MRLSRVGLVPLLLAGSIIVSGTAVGAGATVNIVNFAFSPTNITLPVGGSVTWTNMDAASHTATANNGSFDTGVLGPGSSKIAFSVAGTYSYHCSIHPTMTGTVTVTGAVATPSPSPAPTAPPASTAPPPPPPPAATSTPVAPTVAPTAAETASPSATPAPSPSPVAAAAPSPPAVQAEAPQTGDAPLPLIGVGVVVAAALVGLALRIARRRS